MISPTTMGQQPRILTCSRLLPALRTPRTPPPPPRPQSPPLASAHFTVQPQPQQSLLCCTSSMNLDPIPDFLVDLADLGQPRAHVRAEPLEQALDVGEGLQTWEVE